jgi:hypothetical protein
MQIREAQKHTDPTDPDPPTMLIGIGKSAPWEACSLENNSYATTVSESRPDLYCKISFNPNNNKQVF